MGLVLYTLLLVVDMTSLCPCSCMKLVCWSSPVGLVRGARGRRSADSGRVGAETGVLSWRVSWVELGTPSSAELVDSAWGLAGDGTDRRGMKTSWS